jgi:hypothetical protein
MLEKYYAGDDLKSLLSSRFQLFPDISDRTFWESLAEDYAGQFVKAADKALEKGIPPFPLSIYGKYQTDGSRSGFE